MTTTRLTYTSGAAAPELNAAFERTLREVRRGPADALAHVVGGERSHDGPMFEREDPSHRDAVATRAHAAPDALVAEAVERGRGAQPDWRRTALAERCALLRRAGAEISERHMEMPRPSRWRRARRARSRSPRSRRPST